MGFSNFTMLTQSPLVCFSISTAPNSHWSPVPMQPPSQNDADQGPNVSTLVGAVLAWPTTPAPDGLYNRYLD
ncbi:unnamed protein product [Fusarium graminearum]|uniref:Chromosome 1, complete genome n=2 Tax=Gibberella zeae TaxID=5518 RepID=A0A098D452_GIBZE|nr:hypothetical protein HG531_013978 [Fusarium graminearum]CAF3481504.1 unnamed protein product [Fusarium graminearum]CAF3546702.1 unnamed protein product [Fusarium graminearum]CAF3592398.1 unnamed protein product [Fusarium graminearum]CAG1959729.1 unnamed protein product [Fusarium graminearum]